MDVAAVLSLVRQRWPEQPHAALGMSMGAAALCIAADESRHCHALILEGLYPDILAAWAKRLPRYRCPSLARITPALIRRCEEVLGARFEDVAPRERIARLAPAPLEGGGMPPTPVPAPVTSAVLPCVAIVESPGCVFETEHVSAPAYE